MTELPRATLSLVPNTRTPGTPVCHPDDAWEPRSRESSSETKAPAHSSGSSGTAEVAPCYKASGQVGKSAADDAVQEAREADYIELHAASAFSFLDGASQPESLIERAVELDMPAMALADRNGLYGAARFHTAAQRNGVRAHIGAEIAVSSFGGRLTPPAWLPHQCPEEPPRILLLCASQAGYQNLAQLITRLKMRETTKAEGAATLDDLEEFSSGLLCLTGG
jgi:hypothetical protein